VGTVSIIPDGRSSQFRFIPTPKDAVLVASSQTGAVGVGVLVFMIFFFTIIYGTGFAVDGKEILGLVIFLLGASLVALIILIWRRMKTKQA
jgi:hypothetical protein